MVILMLLGQYRNVTEHVLLIVLAQYRYSNCLLEPGQYLTITGHYRSGNGGKYRTSSTPLCKRLLARYSETVLGQ